MNLLIYGFLKILYVKIKFIVSQIKLRNIKEAPIINKDISILLIIILFSFLRNEYKIIKDKTTIIVAQIIGATTGASHTNGIKNKTSQENKDDGQSIRSFKPM
jgi:hypothetical protein